MGNTAQITGRREEQVHPGGDLDRLSAEEEKRLFLRDVLTTIDNALRSTDRTAIPASAPVKTSEPSAETAAMIDDFLENL